MLTLSSFLGSNIIETIGNLIIDQIKAGLGLTSDNIAFIQAIDGSIVNGRVGNNSGAGNSNLLSGRAYLFAKNNIGAAGTGVFTTEAGALEGQATLGSAYITNTGAMTVGGVTGAATGIVAAGPVNITTMSPLTIATNIQSGSDIILTSHDSAGNGDTLTVNAGVTLQSSTKVVLSAGDHLILTSTAAVIAPLIELHADDVSNDTLGGTIEMYGTLDGLDRERVWRRPWQYHRDHHGSTTRRTCSRAAATIRSTSAAMPT